MSSSTTNSGTPKKPPTGSKSGKKPKSPGFIESSQFKPTWLETGPLSPDMLPDSATLKPAAAPLPTPPDELNNRLETLQRLYNDQQPDPTDVIDTGPRILVMSEQPVPVPAAEPTADVPPATPPASIRSADEEIEAVVEAILEASAQSETAPTEAMPDSTAAEPTGTVAAVAVAALGDEAAPPNTADVAELSTVAFRQAEPVAIDIPDVLPAAAAVPVVETAAEVAVPPPPPVARPRQPEPKPPAKSAKSATPDHHHRLMDRTAWVLATAGLVFLGLALLTSLINPLQRIALSTATLARPTASSGLAAPAADASWCVSGDFLGAGETLSMVDNGASGDLIADDRIFSAQYSLPAGTTATWQIVNCSDASVAYPTSPAWVAPRTDGKPVTFTFDSRERQARLFFPIPFVVSAADDTATFRVIGSFQDWDENDPSGVLEPIGPGLYQQVRRVSRAGTHEAFVIADNREQAVDAYGRTTEPIPFSFQTVGRADYVVFLMDVGRGRASILYGMPPAITYFAYGPGARLISLGLALLGLTLLGWLLGRLLYMRDSKRWLESGCPECHRHELMRVARRGGDRTWNTLGLPVYRYQCRDCTWEGLRLSDTGAPISPYSSAVSEHTGGTRRPA